MRYSALKPGLKFANRYTIHVTVQTLYQQSNSKRSNQVQRNFRMQHKNISIATYSFSGEALRVHVTIILKRIFEK